MPILSLPHMYSEDARYLSLSPPRIVSNGHSAVLADAAVQLRLPVHQPFIVLCFALLSLSMGSFRRFAKETAAMLAGLDVMILLLL